jgi:hypothetical protein
MTTRRQLSTIALDHLLEADNALAAATALREQTIDQEHKDITAILERLTGRDARDLLIRNPDLVLSLIDRLQRYHDRALARDARALAFEEKAKRLLIAAQHAH